MSLVKTTTINTGLGNYYGVVEFEKVEYGHGKVECFMKLDNWDGPTKIKITQGMFEEALKIDWDDEE